MALETEDVDEKCCSDFSQSLRERKQVKAYNCGPTVRAYPFIVAEFTLLPHTFQQSQSTRTDKQRRAAEQPKFFLVVLHKARI